MYVKIYKYTVSRPRLGMPSSRKLYLSIPVDSYSRVPLDSFMYTFYFISIACDMLSLKLQTVNIEIDATFKKTLCKY